MNVLRSFTFSLGSPTGKLKQDCGRAVNDHLDDSPGEFRVTFDTMDSLFAGFYWIVRLGEIEDGQSQYPWAIVSVPFQTSLFILARDVDEFKRKYEADALVLVRELGYKYFFNKPLETVHSAECKYPPRPKPGPPKPGPAKPEPPQDPPQPTAETEVESVESAEAFEELVEADLEETDRRLRFQHDDSRKTKRPSSDKTKKPKPPSMRRTKQPNKSKQPKEPKSKPPTPGKPDPPPTSGKPEPPPTPSKPEPPPTPSKEKPEPPPTVKPKPPPPPQKLKPPPPPGKPEPPPPPLFEV